MCISGNTGVHYKIASTSKISSFVAMIKFIRYNESIQCIKSRYKMRKMKKERKYKCTWEHKKQNYINGVDFLQYYKKQLNILHFTLLTEHWSTTKSKFLHRDKNSIKHLKMEKHTFKQTLFYLSSLCKNVNILKL